MDYVSLVRREDDTTITVSYGKSETTVTQGGMYFVRCYMDNQSTNIGDKASCYVWVNKGSTALPYSPYFRETLPIPGDALDGWGQGVNAQLYNKIVLDPLEGVKKYRQVCAKRAYEDGDENLANAITDGTKETVYELAAPVETDVSHLFTDDNLLPVEAGGTITAVNEYEQAVPFTIEYTVKGA